MNHQQAFLTFATGMAALTCNAREDNSTTTKHHPNVLFIAVDDLRPELGFYGKNQIVSPNMDKLASEGMLFTKAYCNIPVSGASRASLMTGLRPTRDRFKDYYTRIDLEAPGVPTVAEYFKQNGYYTISNGKIIHHPNDGAGSWDEEWWPRTKGSFRDYATEENISMDKAKMKVVPYEKADVHDTCYRDGKIALKAINDLKRLKAMDKPFFLACGFFKPHLPFNAPAKYWEMYDSAQIKLPSNYTLPHGVPKEALNNWGELRAYGGIPAEGVLDEALAKKLIMGYYASVSYVDAQIGLVLDALRETGLAENTIVILWGDHGWSLGEHSFWCKHSNYNVANNSALIARIPGGQPNSKINAVIEFVDIYPTLCDWAGLPLPSHLEGKSFAHLVKDPSGPTDGIAISQWQEGLSIFNGFYAYTEWSITDDNYYARMLFDHQNDPNENNNIAETSENAETVKTLSALLKANRGADFNQPLKVTYTEKDK